MESLILERLSLEDVRTMLTNGSGLLIDTLPPEHFEARHIPGAVNACVYDMTFPDLVAAIAPDTATSIVLYGAGPASRDSHAAAEKLLRAGYTHVALFPGGLEEWHAEGLPLEGRSAEGLEPPMPILDLASRLYRLVPDESVLRWTGRSNTAHHSGTLVVSEGQLDARGLEPSASFTLDMQSISALDLAGDPLKQVLEAHLMSDDFFFTTMFPTGTFRTTAVRLVADGQSTRPNAMIQGDLSLQGFSQEIAFPAHIRNLPENRLGIIANLDFDRTQWGILYGSSRFFHHLGFHAVYDFISVEFRLVLR